VLLLNKYEISSISEYPVWRCKTVETAKREVALRTTLVLKIGLKKFLSINFHQKMSQAKKLARDGCVITFLDNFIFFWVPSMKNINLNILKI
jgi:hypothetical protein